MDIKEVSSVDKFVNFMDQIRRTAEQASRRKGQLVSDHAPAEKLILKFLGSLFLASAVGPSPRDMAIITSQIPPPYPPCVRSVSDLEPIKISEMRLETHHRGKRALLRVRTPPQRMTAVMAIVEDEQGTAVLLQLYFQPDESVIPASEIIQPGHICVLKEPFFKCATDGSYSLRIDHLGDIIWLDGSDELVPAKWKTSATALEGSSQSIRMQGNKAVQGQDWAAAHRLYSSAIQTAKSSEEEQLAYLNRSLANLRLGRPQNAMSDATKGYDSGTPSEKGLFREARALYDLGDFEGSLGKLEILVKSYPENIATKMEMQRVRARLQEQLTGAYQFQKMYKQAKQTPPLIDCATFSAPVEVRSSPGRGRGLFTTKAVSAGELLLCEKAFAYTYAAEDSPKQSCRVLMNMSTKKMVVGGQAQVLIDIVQKLYHDPQASQGFKDLWRGDYPMPEVTEADGVPVVDSFLVEKIVSLNAFGCPRTSRAFLLDLMSDKENQSLASRHSHTTCGVWLLASRINHSCVGNCRRSFIGDMLIIRATRDIPKGSELFFCYQPPTPLESYEQSQKHLGNWGFKCTCRLCMDRKATPGATFQKRNRLVQSLMPVIRRLNATDVPKAKQLLKRLEETYPVKDDAVALELWDPYFALGAGLLENGKPGDAIEAIVKGFEALGYKIIASPPFGDAKVPHLEIKRWGVVIDFVPWAFLNLFMAYREIALELCATAKRYVEISYSMAVGEKETWWETFPDLLL